ncbi:hypothetical protein GCM10010176_036610 [Nonomuraea spiralis]|nr:hypothetical protein GCM10010176_036610 [Nonomuraea spiralis]
MAGGAYGSGAMPGPATVCRQQLVLVSPTSVANRASPYAEPLHALPSGRTIGRARRHRSGDDPLREGFHGQVVCRDGAAARARGRGDPQRAGDPYLGGALQAGEKIPEGKLSQLGKPVRAER